MIYIKLNCLIHSHFNGKTICITNKKSKCAFLFSEEILNGQYDIIFISDEKVIIISRARRSKH